MTATIESSDDLEEGFVERAGEGFYAVPDVDRMPPFLMSVVSDGDRWMFVSSSGALTAGRSDATRALFPYDTDDRLHTAAGTVGPVTAIRPEDGEPGSCWRPFLGDTRHRGHRNLYKSVVGDSVVFEETDERLGLSFSYRWRSCQEFGFVRTATLVNTGRHAVRLDVADGLVNLLPYGIDPGLSQSMSNLANAYKRSQLVGEGTRLAVYSLESAVADRPEPAEVLRATTVWSVGFEESTVDLSPDAVADLTDGRDRLPVTLLTGRPGAYLLTGPIELPPGAGASWHIVADVGQDQVAVAALDRFLRDADDGSRQVERSLEAATRTLVRIMAPADALQRTGDRVATAHQFANVTYNVMRGGVPITGYRISTSDFVRFLRERNRDVARRWHAQWLTTLPPLVDRDVLIDSIRATGDPDLLRLGFEYLPFGFSRRHGDPSRPWNRFSIRVRGDDGEPILYYEGNWRDIFQNWEALCHSFPDYLPSVITTFVNASTVDGHNPYRITRHGIDWEVPEPEDPWSNIGYWGDHQIVYLLRLLEAADAFSPGTVADMLRATHFAYADVPYRIADYEALERDPKSTITYDEEAAERSDRRVDDIGGDGRLLRNRDDSVHHVTFAEKLTVPALAKLSNFVPGGGIWMNTQRPEWNDANNALVGYGLSMVTLFHLRRYLAYVQGVVATVPEDRVPMSAEVATWMSAVAEVLASTDPREAAEDDRARKALMDGLGEAFSDYRGTVYAHGFSGTVDVDLADLSALCEAALTHLEHTIRESRRPDGLYHSYNLIRFPDGRSAATVEHLHEMLEGQVAVLSSGLLSPGEQAEVLDALFSSDMYRTDQRSFMLYPARRPPSFLEKNVVPPAEAGQNPLLRSLLEAGDRSILVEDADGTIRFHADFANRRDVDRALDVLAADPAWSDLVRAHRRAVLDAYEAVFHHHAYTGRSGSMYGYEGIGSIYWHMVAKLLVATQEAAYEARDGGAPHDVVARLVDHYWRIRSGLGFNKAAREFGAIPTDPYSHTPAHAGAQQPGMTGLVKEELLTRPGEIGVRVADGRIHIDPLFLRAAELLDETESWDVDLGDERATTIDLPAGSLGATVCEVPFVLAPTSDDPRVELEFVDGRRDVRPGSSLDRDASAAIFSRTGEIALIRAFVSESSSPEA